MGDASLPPKEHILCLLPFPEDSRISERIKKNHPNIELKYKQITFERGKSLTIIGLPDGWYPTLQLRPT